MISFSKDAATISEKLSINSIVWIHSLPEAELGPSRRILEDLEGLATSGGFPLHVFSASDRSGLSNIFANVTKMAREGLRPLLHVDCHGSPSRGLSLSPSGEQIGWSDTISFLRDLNVATENNLVCVFALCFGLHVYKQVSLKKPAPAYLFFAPPAEVSVGFLEEQTLSFYRQTNETLDVTAAFKDTLGQDMEMIHCQGLFFESLLRYIRAYCMGKGRRKRLERMMTEILRNCEISNPTREELKHARAQVKDRLKPGQELVDKFGSSFLIGRTAAFKFEHLEEFLRRHAGPKSPR